MTKTCSKCKWRNKCEDAKIQICCLKDNEHLIETGWWKGPDRIHTRYVLVRNFNPFPDLEVKKPG